ncbi:MAG: hypothetical protein ABGZ53_02305 [Fuerstiella sp.]
MTKKQATISQLEEDGNKELAERVRNWRNDIGQNGGWDSWFKSNYPDDAKRYGVAQRSIEGDVTSSVKRRGNSESRSSRATSTGDSRPNIAEVKCDEVLEIASGLERQTERLFDLYCFADYRGDKNDSGKGVEVVLGLPNRNELCHISEISGRASLHMFWHDLLVALGQGQARLLFGQDHQYGVPVGLINELIDNGFVAQEECATWRKAMKTLFLSGKFGSNATEKFGFAGGFAFDFNEEIRKKGGQDYFYSATNGRRYGIPTSRPPGRDSLFRVTENECLNQPKEFARVGDPGAVGGQSIVGIPYLLKLLEEWDSGVHVWPQDGLELPEPHSHVLVEVYPSALRPQDVPQSDLNDAVACVEWCMAEDSEKRLRNHLSANALPRDRNTPEGKKLIQLEGWYLQPK